MKETYELWETEKYPFEDLLRKTKELARARKLDTDVARGKSGVAVRNAQAQGAWGGGGQEMLGNTEDVNAFGNQTKPKGKGKGTMKRIMWRQRKSGR